MWTFLNNLFFSNRITGIYEWRDLERNSHLFIFTGKRVVEVDYDTKAETLVITSKQIKELKEKAPQL